MPLCTVTGSSGSGKTTFLNDVHKSHRCTYIRQYHEIRPYVTVSKIPNFDPTTLPFWDTYEKEGKANTIKAGGTMAGEFTAGLSGGQRKLLLLELLYQRTRDQSDLLICMDEIASGVTDGFLPFIVSRLNEMRKKHNILLVTNDHVDTLREMADNTITVSAIDRSTVLVNDKSKVDREKAILALSVGGEYDYQASMSDLKFFFDVEVVKNAGVMAVAAFAVLIFSLYLATFWNSAKESAALVAVAGNMISYFCLNPYLLALVDWRNFMSEEAEALLHSSKSMNKALKSLLTLLLLLVVSLIQFGATNAVIDGFESISFWVAMVMDNASMTLPFICFGLYTRWPFQLVSIVASTPFLFMIFFSTTFSPGSGLPGLKELRYLFPRFYFWCMLPGDTADAMENCPETDAKTMSYMVLSSLLGLILFIIAQAIGKLVKSRKAEQTNMKNDALRDEEFHDLQIELYGDRALELSSTNHSGSTNNAVAPHGAV